VARDRLHQFLHGALEVTGLIGPLHRRAERRHGRETEADYDDGRPMPSVDLRAAVAGSGDARWFSERGRHDAEWFKSLAAKHGLATPRDLLDWGCGCGRIARWWAPEVVAAGGRFTGSDLNPQLVAWCAANLPGRYLRNRLRPPFKLPSGSLDLVYALSVLTHLTEPVAKAWLAEVARVLRPGGLALLSFHDEDYAEGWAPAEVPQRLATQAYVVWNNAAEGTNYLSSWTTRAHMRSLAAEVFEVEEIVPSDADHNQAMAVLRSR
jgi:SAM-dependent methyltransferase